MGTHTNQINTPAHLILSPSDNSLALSNIDFSCVGNSISRDSEAFKKIQKFSKVTTNHISNDILSHNNMLQKLSNIYLTPQSLNSNSVNYGITRQHNFSAMDSVLPSFTTLVDKKSFEKFCMYTLKSTSSPKTHLNPGLSQ